MKSSTGSSTPADAPAAEGVEAATADAAPAEIKVWDLPVRLFHWLLVVLFGVSWYTGKNGGIDEMGWHLWAGYGLLALVLFRIGWGLIGSTSARFSHFLSGPKTTARYALGLARRNPPRFLGHTPLGGWMVAVLLLSLLVQAGTGLFASDDLFTEGPWVGWVTKSTSDWLTEIHKSNFDLLLVLAGLHVAAVLYYAIVLRENLIAAMFTGRKRLPPGQRPPRLRFAGVGAAAVLAAVSAMAVYTLVR